MIIFYVDFFFTNPDRILFSEFDHFCFLKKILIVDPVFILNLLYSFFIVVLGRTSCQYGGRAPANVSAGCT